MLRNEGWHPAEYLVLRRFLKALGMEPTQGAHSLAFVQCATVFHAQQPSWEQPGSLSADEWERKFDPDKIMGGSVLRFAVSEVSVHRWQILFLWARGEADIMAEGKEEERGNPITGWMPGQAKAGHSRAASHTSLWGSPPIYTRTVEFYPALRREKGWHVLVNRRNRRTAPGEMARPGVTDLISHLNLLIKAAPRSEVTLIGAPLTTCSEEGGDTAQQLHLGNSWCFQRIRSYRFFNFSKWNPVLASPHHSDQ
ncbi:uncharacterized protein LOC124100258 isoform X2 [Marmota monax]|uniref:uncharacterized protein LOC124100258 isoform X2 n=1 Tax=Marmota monax TaxID=9995 RepID=UPI001EB038F6|nr:uncharacterized protein LOC124100258 isoform X2 [Marmota monax]